MVFFVTVLKALAACLITNAHYTGIYPTDIIANGGLIGDVLFFAVSGYCLYNIKFGFVKWYSKRIVRCYLPVLIATAIYMLLGFYTLKDNGVFWWYVYPTYYHFVASIVVLYVPYFLIIKCKFLREHLWQTMIVIGCVSAAVYVFFYDKSYYHVDTVREPFIRFLFMESMLLGAWFRQRDNKYRAKFSWWHFLAAFTLFVIYFGSKLLFSKVEQASDFQIVNQLLLFALLFFVFRLFSGLDGLLNKIPSVLRSVITFVSEITLEIYVVQYVLIDLIRPLAGFPINWIVLTVAIFSAAVVLHYVCKPLLGLFDRMLFSKNRLFENAEKGKQ